MAPIINKKDPIMNRVVHRMFIPEGTWYDIFTGKKFPGNRNYISFFKDEDYPVFAKAGSIIPMGYNENVNDTTPPKNMEIQVFPGVSNTYHMYEDDGLSDLYKKGYYLLTNIEKDNSIYSNSKAYGNIEYIIEINNDIYISDTQDFYIDYNEPIYKLKGYTRYKNAPNITSNVYERNFTFF